MANRKPLEKLRITVLEKIDRFVGEKIYGLPAEIVVGIKF